MVGIIIEREPLCEGRDVVAEFRRQDLTLFQDDTGMNDSQKCSCHIH
jgi:hypothetical protein